MVHLSLSMYNITFWGLLYAYIMVYIINDFIMSCFMDELYTIG